MRYTQSAYIKGLKEGYAFAKSQYCEQIKSIENTQLISPEEYMRFYNNLAELESLSGNEAGEAAYRSAVTFMIAYMKTIKDNPEEKE